MLISDKLILVELHKTGSARLKKLLGDLVGGETNARHTVYADELATMNKPVVGYICNPLTWYLEQWRIGCTGKGDIYKRLTDPTKWDLLRSKRGNRTPKDTSKEDAKTVPEGWGADHAKNVWYADAENPAAFREWLQAVIGIRGVRMIVDHGYHVSPVNRLAGLMTYHYFNMFVRGGENMPKSVDTMEALEAMHAEKRLTPHFIRSESVSADLRRVLDALGVPLTDEQRAAVEALKERAGADEAAIVRFYDPASQRLVTKRDDFLNKVFDYTPPSQEARAATKAALKEKSAAKTEKKGEKEGGPKLSAAEKEQKRQARAERQAGKKAEGGAKKAEKPAKPEGKPAKADKAEKAEKAAKAPKPEKVKRIKNRPADNDIIDSDE